MICKVCYNKAVKNQALGKEFYYCRTCKEEVTEEKGFQYTLEDFNEMPPSQDEFDSLYEIFFPGDQSGNY